MKKTLSGASALLLVFSLAACATSQGTGTQSGVSVTRFHLGQEIARGEIRVEPANPERANSLQFDLIAGSVERELTRLGWTVARGNARSEQVALVRIDQGSPEAMRSRSGGVGGGAPAQTGGSSGGTVVTELGVRIQRRSDATVAWEGRASLEARAATPLAEPAAAADRLATALFQDFPGESGRTIRVR